MAGALEVCRLVYVMVGEGCLVAGDLCLGGSRGRGLSDTGRVVGLEEVNDLFGGRHGVLVVVVSVISLALENPLV